VDTTPPAPDTRNQPTEGSSLYYSLLFAEPDARVRVWQTLQLVNTVSTTLNDVSEPTIAEKKIHWWHEELARLAQQSARHPACVAVQGFLHRPDAANALVSILSTAATERYSPLATNTELHEMLVADYGARLTLVEKALAGTVTSGNGDAIVMYHADALHKNHANALQNKLANTSNPDQSDAATKPSTGALQKKDAAAFGLGQVHRLSTLTHRLNQGYSVFSDEQYAEHNTTPEQLLNNPEKRREMLSTAIEQGIDTLNQAIDELGANRATTIASLPIQTMTRLRLSQLKLWQKKKPDLLREYIALTPIRKFIIAYRCKRRFA